jgi:competence protein ComEA
MLIILARPLDAQQKRTTNQWEVLEDCRLLTNAPLDGDSFHVEHQGREYVFRLYFVDAPETEVSPNDDNQKKRVEDQAAYFGISQDDVLRVGQLARTWTRARLDKPFTIITRYQNARGMGSLARYYAIVLTEGQNLAFALVSQGLARIHGPRANWPDGPRSTMFVSQLKNAELEAREKRRGAWDDSQFSPFAKPKPPEKRLTEKGAKGVGQPFQPININEASVEELASLPGIGPKLAERIIANRPYASVKDLERVNGIGRKTLDKIRSSVTVGEE